MDDVFKRHVPLVLLRLQTVKQEQGDVEIRDYLCD